MADPTYENALAAMRKAYDAGDMVAAKRMAAFAKKLQAQPVSAATEQPQAAPQPAMTNGFELGSGQLATAGPGPTGSIDPALYEMGAIGRRMQPATPSFGAGGVPYDMAASALAGLSRGAAGMADLPANLMDLAVGAAEGLTGRDVPELQQRGMMALVPGGMKRVLDPQSSVRQDLADATGNASEFRGDTTAGKVAGTIAEFVPGAAAFGGLSLPNLARNAVLAGAASEGAGQMAEGTPYEDIARVAGAVIGGSLPPIVNIGTKAFRNAFRMSAERPSLETLRTAKTVAYKAVDDAGEMFAPTELQGMVAKIRTGLDDMNYLPEADTVTTGVLKRLDDIGARDISIGQLDKMRQSVWARYNTSKEPGLLEVIEGIDDLVAARSSTSELLDAARLANGRYKKAELLDLAFTKATDQTASTGSNGNILNKYKQAVTSIINNPRQAKWFAGDEIAVMREFVRGTPTQNFLRRVGKLAPSGNGLMMALNLGAAGTFGAPALAISAGASAAKAVTDGAVERAAQGLIGRVAGQAQPTPVVGGTTRNLAPYIAGTNALSGR